MTVLITLLREGVRAVPATRYAVGVVGIFAAAAIVRRIIGHDFWEVMIIFGCMLIMMCLLLVFSTVVARVEQRGSTQALGRRQRGSIPQIPSADARRSSDTAKPKLRAIVALVSGVLGTAFAGLATGIAADYEPIKQITCIFGIGCPPPSKCQRKEDRFECPISFRGPAPSSDSVSIPRSLRFPLKATLKGNISWRSKRPGPEGILRLNWGFKQGGRYMGEADSLASDMAPSPGDDKWLHPKQVVRSLIQLPPNDGRRTGSVFIFVEAGACDIKDVRDRRPSDYNECSFDGIVELSPM